MNWKLLTQEIKDKLAIYFLDLNKFRGTKLILVIQDQIQSQDTINGSFTEVILGNITLPLSRLLEIKEISQSDDLEIFYKDDLMSIRFWNITNNEI